MVNLGFGGSALFDSFTARAMRDTPEGLISINAVNTSPLRLRAFTPAVHGFLDTVREGYPTTPLLVISPPLLGPGGPRLSRPRPRRRDPACQGRG